MQVRVSEVLGPRDGVKSHSRNGKVLQNALEGRPGHHISPRFLATHTRQFNV